MKSNEYHVNENLSIVPGAQGKLYRIILVEFPSNILFVFFKVIQCFFPQSIA